MRKLNEMTKRVRACMGNADKIADILNELPMKATLKIKSRYCGNFISVKEQDGWHTCGEIVDNIKMANACQVVLVMASNHEGNLVIE